MRKVRYWFTLHFAGWGRGLSPQAYVWCHNCTSALSKTSICQMQHRMLFRFRFVFGFSLLFRFLFYHTETSLMSRRSHQFTQQLINSRVASLRHSEIDVTVTYGREIPSMTSPRGNSAVTSHEFPSMTSFVLEWPRVPLGMPIARQRR